MAFTLLHHHHDFPFIYSLTPTTSFTTTHIHQKISVSFVRIALSLLKFWFIDFNFFLSSVRWLFSLPFFFFHHHPLFYFNIFSFLCKTMLTIFSSFLFSFHFIIEIFSAQQKEPFFESNQNLNVTVLENESVVLKCSVRHKGNKTVSTQTLLPLFSLFFSLLSLYLFFDKKETFCNAALWYLKVTFKL